MLSLNTAIEPPQNETPEHFLLKQVAVVLLKTRFKCIVAGPEVYVSDYYLREDAVKRKSYMDMFRETRTIADAVGINRDHTVRVIEVKASLNDYKSGLCITGDLNYVLAPKGVIPKDELFPGLGLIEANMEDLEFTNRTFEVLGVSITKNPRRIFERSKERHERWVRGMTQNIARSLTSDYVYKGRWFYPGYGMTK